MSAGIYQIKNKVTGNSLIGGSINAIQVLTSISKILSSKERPSGANNCLNLERKISIDWQKYGEEAFNLRVIEKTSPSQTVISRRAMYWCRVLQPVYNEYEYDPIVSGIYKLINTSTKQSYIGQSKDIYNRFNQHKSCLNQNIHHNQALQKSWNNYGSDKFRIEIIEECIADKTILTLLEQSWIKRTCNLFNVQQ